MNTDYDKNNKTLYCQQTVYANVAIDIPLYQTYDYIFPTQLLKNINTSNLLGSRVLVPFGKKTLVGVILALSNHSSLQHNKIKSIISVLDENSLIDDKLFQMVNWSSQYYLHPIGEVFKSVFPSYLEKDNQPDIYYQINQDIAKTELDRLLQNAPKQKIYYQKIEQFFKTSTFTQENQSQISVSREKLLELIDKNYAILKNLINKNLFIQVVNEINLFNNVDAFELNAISSIELNAKQAAVYNEIYPYLGEKSCSKFKPFLLHGITGSGKTRIYIKLIFDMIALNRQCLIMVPEISLTPQLIQRLEKSIGYPVETLHSSKTPTQRRKSWHNIQSGKSLILVGTRSAIFTPFKDLGLIIIDEEHDQSYKQQEGFRFHARDIAVICAKKFNIPIVLGSATPSLESMHNSLSNYQYLFLNERAGDAVLPKVHLIDLKNSPSNQGLTPQLIQAIKNRLEKKEQSLIFLNRRGFAPVLMCRDCHWIAQCQRCHAKLTLHQKNHHVLNCHYCGSQRPQDSVCPSCQSQKLMAIGEGTQRLETYLKQIFPDADIARLDKDQTNTKGNLEKILNEVKENKTDIIIGTQMLSKGHDFPNVTLVGIINPDSALFSADFRSTERIMQLMIQVSGRAGRAEKQGVVIIQTAFVDNPYYQFVKNHDYHGFTKHLLKERKLTGLPPYKFLSLFRADSVKSITEAMIFLNSLKSLADEFIQQNNLKSTVIYHPLPASMEKRQGRFRAQWAIIAENRKDRQYLLQYLIHQIANIKNKNRVRWSIDVDPLDMY